MISLITINYNNAKVTCELLASIQELGLWDIEVVVVDNGSKENPDVIARRFPWIKFVRSERNLGFAGGNNLGVQHATGDYLFFVNNDTEFKTDIIHRLVSRFDEDPTLGIVCPVLHYFDAPEKVQYAGFTQINSITGRNKCVLDASGVGLSYTSYAHGAAMMMPRRVFDIIGEMPENYFVYYEEMDWSEIVRRHGFHIAVDKNVVLYHKESQTVKKLNEMKSYLMTRNRILFMRRNKSTAQVMLFWLYFLVVATPKQLLVYLGDGEWKNIAAHIAGIVWNIFSRVDDRSIGYKFNYLGTI